MSTIAKSTSQGRIVWNWAGQSLKGAPVRFAFAEVTEDGTMELDVRHTDLDEMAEILSSFDQTGGLVISLTDLTPLVHISLGLTGRLRREGEIMIVNGLGTHRLYLYLNS